MSFNVTATLQLTVTASITQATASKKSISLLKAECLPQLPHFLVCPHRNLLPVLSGRPSAATQSAVASSITETQVALQLSISLPDWAVSSALRLLLVRTECKTSKLKPSQLSHTHLFLFFGTKQHLTLVGFCCI